jgi:tetratricopeptide (TPR) repeat protein
MIYMGEDARATEFAERCVALSRASGDQSQLGPVYAHLGDLAWARGDMVQAANYYQESLKVSRLMSRPSDETSTLSQIGDLLCRTGDFSGAIAMLEQALAISTRIGERWYSMMSLAHLSEVYRRTGDISASLQKLRDGLEIVSTVHSGGIRALYLLKAALLWAQQESMEQAAIWIGVLQANEKELIRHHDSDRADLDDRLKEMLGPDEYTRLTAHGKSLNLELTIQHLLRHLTDRPALHTAFNETIRTD